MRAHEHMQRGHALASVPDGVLTPRDDISNDQGRPALGFSLVGADCDATFAEPPSALSNCASRLLGGSASVYLSVANGVGGSRVSAVGSGPGGRAGGAPHRSRAGHFRGGDRCRQGCCLGIGGDGGCCRPKTQCVWWCPQLWRRTKLIPPALRGRGVAQMAATRRCCRRCCGRRQRASLVLGRPCWPPRHQQRGRRRRPLERTTFSRPS
jgi:hypothetical protein